MGRNLELTKSYPRGNEVLQPSFLATFARKANYRERANNRLFTISNCHFSWIFGYLATKKLDKTTTYNFKEKRWKVSQPHFGASVRMRLALPKVGTWSPPGLPKLQGSMARVKTPRVEVFFIPLQRSWRVGVENGLAWTIRTSAAQVMVERKAGSQTDH
jgi:hypothetical protein